MSSLTIRKANREDASLILAFIRELAVYERAEEEVIATEATIADSLFGPDACADAVIAEREGTAIGYAVYFFNYSTWLGKNGLFLEDLYITPDERGHGAGKGLLKHLARIAVGRGCGRFEWNVLDWNESAISFYESLGARPQSEWIGYRLTGRELMELAESD